MNHFLTWIMGVYWRKVEPTSTSRMEHQWAYAKQEGTLIVSAPGDRLRGFNDFAVAMLYLEAGCIKDGKDLKNVLVITDRIGHA